MIDGEQTDPDPGAEAPSRKPTAPLVRRAKREGGGGRSKKSGFPALIFFLLFGAAPAAIAAWFFTRPEEDQAAMLSRLPEGIGGRALKAGICVAVLFGLARLALPAFHGTGAFLKGTLLTLRAKPPLLRVLLFPAELLLYLLWIVVQILFAVDAVLILAACAATLILVARIVRPDLFESWLPEILK